MFNQPYWHGPFDPYQSALPPGDGYDGMYHARAPQDYRTSSTEWWRQVAPLAHGSENIAQRPPRSRVIDWHSIYPSEVILNGPTQVKRISLTFDDGPDTVWTPRIMAALAQFGVKATFNCVGQRIEQNPQMLVRLAQQGHMIANHSYNHPNFTRIPITEARGQLNYTSDIIQRVVGVRPRFFRPPYGALNDDVIRMVMSLGYKILYWDVDSLDWAGLTATQVSINVLSHTEPGSIILMHFAGGVGESLEDTVQALPYIIQRLQSEGYSFVTVAELLGEPAYAPLYTPQED